MSRYRVLIPWTNSSGEHAIGDVVECNAVDPVDVVDLERMIAYGIIEPITETNVESKEDSQDEPESTPARRRATKK